MDWLTGIVYTSLPPSSQLTALLTAWAPAPAGVDQADFLQCPDCYASEVSGSFDASAATDALQSEILDALAAAQRMVDAAPHLTRLFTTMDPSEMTMDPLFVFNPDVEQELDSSHSATNEYHCGVLDDQSDATRTLVLSDGRRIELPSEAWMADHGMTELEYMDELTSPAAIVIENLSDSGQGEIIQDYREQAADEAAQFGQAHSEGCSCATIHRRSLAAAVLFLAALATVRRRGDQ